MKFQSYVLGAAFCFTLLAGCKKEDELQRGHEGESCTRRDDCAGGLSCIANRCVAGSSDDFDGGGLALTSGGKAGESCTRRADCQTGLACVAQVCVEDSGSGLSDGGVAIPRGDRGESCAARNDCRAGLSCIGGHCRETNLELSVQPKECFRVECEADADCCENFVPSSSCPIWLAECQDAGYTFSCDSYNALCKCPYACEESACAVANRCTTDNECSFSLPHCVDEQCVQCETSTDCSDPEAQCVDGWCTSACERNEQCPLFHACQAGKCEEVGCTSDRECYFATNDPQIKCIENECVAPCESDAECVQAFHACEGNRCVFVGCESNEECRVFLNVQNVSGGDTAVCRMPEQD